MITSRSLPVIMPAVAEQRWSCHSCANCCRTLVGHLSKAERQRIDSQSWLERLGVPPYVRAGRSYVLNKHPDGTCVFLDENRLCRIHAEYGEAAKPLACRIFPFSVRPVRHGWQVSFRFDCPSAASSRGKPISQYRAWLGELVRELEHRDPGREDLANLPGNILANAEEIDMVLSRYARWFKRDDLPLVDRLIGAGRITATLQRANLQNVRGPRFAELLDLLFKALPSECASRPEPTTTRQRALLRQLAFVHAEHVSLSELRSGLWGRLRKRGAQLRSARRFHRGVGLVPRLPGFDREIPFDLVESVAPAGDRGDEIENLMVRYLAMRLAGRSVFGQGHYGWPILSGLNALFLGVAATGWLARYVAAMADRSTITFENLADALAIVDRAATRLPSLGTSAERARTAYLANEDGVARLLYEYVTWRT